MSHGRGLRGRSSAAAAGDPGHPRVEYPSVPGEAGSVLSASLPDGLLPVADASRGLPGQHVLVCLFTVQVTFALSSAAALILIPSGLFHHPSLQILAGCLALILIGATVLGTLRYIRSQRRARTRGRGAADLINTILSTSREWLWVVDHRGTFTFSSRTSLTLLGYEPEELVGQPWSTVIEPDDPDGARLSVLASQDPDGFAGPGVIVRCRHRDGSPLWMEVSGRARLGADGTPAGFEGTGRLLTSPTAEEAATTRSRARIREIISGQRLLTAFQPIHDLTTGHVIGAEALSRFVSDDGVSADYWFGEASVVGLGNELEFAAVETALKAAEALPPSLYVALNISPDTCLDPRLPQLLEGSQVSLDRIILELTERLPVEDYAPLAAALEPLRRRGLRIAVDDAGSGFASMRHILHLRPDIIKLDRSLIAGIRDNTGQLALGAAMVEFAQRINATLVAEGIETPAELSAVTGLGMTAGQGYLLGRPSIQPRDWATWPHPNRFTGPDGMPSPGDACPVPEQDPIS
ncbi:sensor domain-containing phosphodiesterase [Arthrobacter humicola]